jgi:hypothetical protein
MTDQPLDTSADDDTEAHRYTGGADAETAEGEAGDTEAHRFNGGADAETAEGDEDAPGH